MVIAIVAIAFGVNTASAPLPAVPTATPTAVRPRHRRPPRPRSSRSQTARPRSSDRRSSPINPPASVHTYAAAPAVTIDATKLYQATIVTPKGDIVLCLQPDLAPNTVNVFVTLARNHFYDGIPFHRVVAGFVIQAGDPQCIGHVPVAPATPSGACGNGGPGFQFADEPVHRRLRVAAAWPWRTAAPTPTARSSSSAPRTIRRCPTSYNLFGQVESGMPVALKIVQGDGHHVDHGSGAALAR